VEGRGEEGKGRDREGRGKVKGEKRNGREGREERKV